MGDQGQGMIHYVGMLKITLIGAKYLPPIKMNGFTDAYCLFYYEGGQSVKSNVVRRSLSPYWAQELMLCVRDLNDPLLLKVYNHYSKRKDVRITKVDIDVKNLVPNESEFREIALPNTKKGVIHVQLCYLGFGTDITS
eukprot:GEZU01011206.1.p1 GENE.GEZU01011206.1~~GEZU01011206.1.p1  ORF type:complete len:154 (-),score=20.66 GEZU01011206.1:88-501(-)